VRDLERASWAGIPRVHQNHNALITGREDVYWVTWLRDEFMHGGDVGDTLSLGCGAGHLDQIFHQHGFRFRSFCGIDISEPAVVRARELATQVGLAPAVEYIAGDLNHLVLPVDRFDFIYFFQSLHHIEALEHVLDQCRAALRPDGLLLVNEFVGPSRFQWTDRQLDSANRIFRRIPAELRRHVWRGTTKHSIERPTVRHMLNHDPSEAVRSAEIERELKARFDVFREWNWGGTLNHLIFQDIAANFDPANTWHQTIVDLLIEHENGLIREGTLPSDFKVFLARRR
jgi:SAM-dependent methyltransferase